MALNLPTSTSTPYIACHSTNLEDNCPAPTSTATLPAPLPRPPTILAGLTRPPIRPSISPLGGSRRTQSDTRGPPLGDPSLEYIQQSSDFIRLPSAYKRSVSSRCVVTLNSSDMARRKAADREGIGEEAPGQGETGSKLKNSRKHCLLIDGVLPLIQTDRLALGAISPTFKPRSITSVGDITAQSSTLQLIDAPSSTNFNATSKPMDIPAPNTPYTAQSDLGNRRIPASASRSSLAPIKCPPPSNSNPNPNAATSPDHIGTSPGVVLGSLAFGGMMYLLSDESMPGVPGHPFGFGP